MHAAVSTRQEEKGLTRCQLVEIFSRTDFCAAGGAAVGAGGSPAVAAGAPEGVGRFSRVPGAAAAGAQPGGRQGTSLQGFGGFFLGL